MTKSFVTNIRGKVRNYPLTKNTPLVPLYEAIVNSIHAIDERKRVDGPYDGHIEIEVVRKYTTFFFFWHIAEQKKYKDRRQRRLR